jgi:hypothetical protein
MITSSGAIMSPEVLTEMHESVICRCLWVKKSREVKL